MMTKRMAHFVERLGLLLAGSFIALGAQLRGWINYDTDWEFWLTPLVLICVFAGKHYADKPNKKGGARRDPLDPDTLYSGER